MKRVDSEILTVDDLADLFACDKETAAARLNSGDLPGVKVGRGWIVPRQALFERLNEKAREEAAARRARQAAVAVTERRSRTPAAPPAAQLKAKPPTTLILPSASLHRGRKRREPPALPTLSSLLHEQK